MDFEWGHILDGLTLICGRSRAGKTTYAKRYDNVIHLDSHGRLSQSYPRVLTKLGDGDVVVEGIYDTAELRTELLNAYKGQGKRVCIWLDTPLDVIKSRFFHVPSKHPYPFEPPTYSEGWDEIIVIRSDSYA